MIFAHNWNHQNLFKVCSKLKIMVYVKEFEKAYTEFERAVREGEQETDQSKFRISFHNPETDKFDIRSREQDIKYRDYIIQKLEVLLGLSLMTEFCKKRLIGEVTTLYQAAHPPISIMSPITKNLSLFDSKRAEGTERILYNELKESYNIIISRIGPNNDASVEFKKSLEEWEKQINKNYVRKT